jgi:hypothetical protein
MGQNDIFTSPLGLGLGVGLGTAAGAGLIGIITYLIYKYALQGQDKVVRDSVSSVSERGSSFFNEGEDPYRDSSFSEDDSPTLIKQYGRPVTQKQLTKKNNNVVVKTTGSPKQPGKTGGKLSKKRRKNRVKKHNTLRK